MYLIDTSIFSYLFRGDPIAQRYADDLAPDAHLFLSVQTIGELRLGAEQRQWGEQRRARLREFMASFTVLPITEATTACYAEVITASRRAGRPLQVADGWIVATAKQYGLTLVAHDKDMRVAETIGISIICRS